MRTRNTAVRLVDLAELLGLSKQRAHHIADEEGFPSPIDQDSRGRLWDRARDSSGEGLACRQALALAVLVRFEPEAAEPVNDARDKHVRKPDNASKERSQEPLLRFVEGRLTTRSRHRTRSIAPMV
jgi:hypothetical protein